VSTTVDQEGRLEALPRGTVTFLLTDIEGSTRCWQDNPLAMKAAVARHDQLLAAGIQEHAGTVLKKRGEGDSFFAVFARASDALAAACFLQRALHAEVWPGEVAIRVRMAIHTGEAHEESPDDYRGTVVNRCARLRSLAVGGQVLLSSSVRELARDNIPSGVTLQDLGEHQLRDLDRPERVFQVVDPALSGVPRARYSTASNLPYLLTSFIGRQTELTVIPRLMADHRLVTLTGPGGIGKTRLAIEVARQLLNSRHIPVYFIDLAPLGDPSLVPQAIASVLGLSDHTTPSFTQTVVDFLAASEVLVLLDNCEHVLAAAATVTTAVVGVCPGVRVLTTSREQLNIPGERVWPVSPLRAPDPDRLPAIADLERFETIQLFTERARAHQPAFVLTEDIAPAVARICHRLDGMPLGVELAAAQTSLLSPDQIVTRLDDRFQLLAGGSRTALARHQTLAATIDWSYNLINAAEQRLFRRLSVFAGSFSLEAVETVCAETDDGGGSILPNLRRLLDASLVLSEEGQGGRRYRMLETLRQYSRERLVESGEMDTIYRRLMAFVKFLATDAEDRARGGDSVRWLAQMEADHDSLRAALDWSASNDSERGLRLALAWVPFWVGRGYVREGYERLTRRLSEGIADSQLRGVTLAAAGRLGLWHGEYATAKRLLDEAVPLLRRYGPAGELTIALHNLDGVQPAMGGYEHADEALAAARESGRPAFVGVALNNLGERHASRGELADARRLFKEGLEICQRAQNLWGIAIGLENLARLDAREGDLVSAAERLSESLSISRRRNDKLSIGANLLWLANIAALQGRPDRALRLAGAVESIRQSLGIVKMGVQIDDGREIDSHIASARDLLGATAATLAWEQGTKMTIDQAVEFAMRREVERPEPAPLSP
jgi:predicted ATPase/class 3 adenylate cyclase